MMSTACLVQNVASQKEENVARVSELLHSELGNLSELQSKLEVQQTTRDIRKLKI